MPTRKRFTDPIERQLTVSRAELLRVLRAGPEGGMTAEMVAQRMLQPIDAVDGWLTDAFLDSEVAIDYGGGRPPRYSVRAVNQADGAAA